MTFDDLKQFIAANMETSIEFGSEEQAPSDEWIWQAERALGCILPASYRWFLENYGGGEIHGDEIFSIYQRPFEEVVGGDVVARTLHYRQSGIAAPYDVAICATDYGELFVLDMQAETQNGDFPVLRITGQNRETYAEGFAEFIVKYVGDAAV